jgi:hypothetical protein
VLGWWSHLQPAETQFSSTFITWNSTISVRPSNKFLKIINFMLSENSASINHLDFNKQQLTMHNTTAKPAPTPAGPHNGAQTITVHQNGFDKSDHQAEVNGGSPATNGNHPTNGAPSLDYTNVSNIPGKTKPIAVVGMSCRFPGGATDPGKFWDMLAEGRNGVSASPPLSSCPVA